MERYSDLNTNDELFEFLQLEQEFESEEVLKDTSHGNSLCNNTRCLEGIKIQDTVGSCVKVMEDYRNDYKKIASGIHDSASRIRGLRSSYLCKEQGYPTLVSHQKSISRLRHGLRGDISDGVHTNLVANNKAMKHGSSTPLTVRQSRSNFTVPQPFNLSTEKRALAGCARVDGRYDQQIQKSQLNVCGDQASETHGSRNFNTILFMAKSEVSTYQVLTQFSFCGDTKHEDDDIVSVSSIQSRQSSITPKAKASKFTSTNGFKFQSDARAEKRKEFYSKIQEKVTSKEKEKTQMQAKIKKEDEAELKLLRRSLTFKASPMPSFYHEGTKIPKLQLPKIPTTQARSPKFSTRHSFSGLQSGPYNATGLCEIKESTSKNTDNPNKVCNHRSLLTRKSPSITNTSKMLSSQTGGSSSLVLDDIIVKERDPLTTISPLIVSSDLFISNEEEHVAHVHMRVTNFSQHDEAKHPKVNRLVKDNGSGSSARHISRNQHKIRGDAGGRIMFAKLQTR